MLMRMYEDATGELKPMWLNAAEIENPIQVFSGFFELHTLPRSRCFLWEMLNSALKNVEAKADPIMSAVEMTSFTTNLMSLMEAAELVSQKKRKTPAHPEVNYSPPHHSFHTAILKNNSLAPLPGVKKKAALQKAIPIDREAIETRELEFYKRLIQSKMDVEKIFLTGKYGSVDNGKIEFELFVLVNNSEEGTAEKLENEVNTTIREYSKVFITTLRVGAANIIIEKGAPYLTFLCDASKMIYDSGRFAVNNIPSNYPMVDVALIAEEHDSLMQTAAGYLKEAEEHYTSENYELCVFMLYKAAEGSLVAVWDPLLPEHLKIRNISKLMRGLRSLEPDIYDIFPRNTKDEIEIFQVLQRAYTLAKYKSSFNISSAQAAVLLERVIALQSIIKKAFVDIAAKCLKGYNTRG